MGLNLDIAISAEEMGALVSKRWESIEGSLPKYITEEVFYETCKRVMISLTKKGDGSEKEYREAVLTVVYTVLKNMKEAYRDLIC